MYAWPRTCEQSLQRMYLSSSWTGVAFGRRTMSKGNGLVRVAAKAFHFEIAITRVEGIAERGRWLRRTLKAEHALVPRLDGEPGRLPCVLLSPALPLPGSMRRNGLA